jgi:hypothetical protein
MRPSTTRKYSNLALEKKVWPPLIYRLKTNLVIKMKMVSKRPYIAKGGLKAISFLHFMILLNF